MAVSHAGMFLPDTSLAKAACRNQGEYVERLSSFFEKDEKSACIFRAGVLVYLGSRQTHPGVAKFGIALEWGSRGLEFESRHSDQKIQNSFSCSGFFLFQWRDSNHQMQVSGGHLLAVGLDGGNSLICLPSGKANVTNLDTRTQNTPPNLDTRTE